MATRVKIVNIQQAFRDPFLKEMEGFKRKLLARVKEATLIMVEELMKATPVWSGETVRNYGVAIGRTGRRSMIVVDKPPKSMQTSKMSLGAEPNRAPMEAAAMAEISGAIRGMRKLETVSVFNSVDADKWDLIDNGNAPAPGRARYPGVVSIIALQNARSRMGDDFK